MFTNLIKYYYTIKDLKWIQIVYQIKNKVRKSRFNILRKRLPSHKLNFKLSEASTAIIQSHNRFQFLNLGVEFKTRIKWGFLKHGLLWNYNLNYFDFLHQKDIENEFKSSLIDDFISSHDGNYDPYPTSLRLINWIIFFSSQDGLSKSQLSSLYSQMMHLASNLEYRLMGNHLLENAFALLFASYFFRTKDIYLKAKRILENELEEQINMDGGHFERSIMYHKIILHRVLQSIDLIRSNPSFEDEGEVLDLLNSKAEMMLGYLRLMSFEDGSFPHFNDSCDGIAPDSDLIFSNASKLDLSVRILPLGQSGFRKFSNEVFEGFINVGSLLPKYIPGHAHSDIAHFVMHLNNRPFIVDKGISTYESNEIRSLERSTSSHNTVVVNNRNQSDVWSAFRVGKKASVLELVEGLRSISISHDAYQKFAIQHRRSFTWTNKSISIIDDVGKEEEACAFLHFHPNVKISENASIYTVEDCYIDFEFANRVEIEDYMFSYGFNDRVTAKRMCIWFTKKLVTKLTVK